MFETTSLTIGCACIFLALLVASRRDTKQCRYPPGPLGLPLFGNLLDLPKEASWYTFAKWARKYNSKIIHFSMLGKHFVVLNSYQVAKEILEDRSRIYSDRKYSVMASELTGWHRNFGLQSYDERWRQRRRMFHQHFKPQMTPTFHTSMIQGARALTQVLLESPNEFLRYFRSVPGANILSIVYAMDLDPRDSASMESVEGAVLAFEEVSDEGPYVVDFLPALKYIPTWFPGAALLRLPQGSVWKSVVDRFHEDSYHTVKSDILSGESRPCVASSLIREFEDRLDDNNVEEDIISASGTAYTASDTTTYVLTNFALAMLLFPIVQKKAQQELDQVVGRDRLPDTCDLDSLPYITAIFKELMRWRPIGPLGSPHQSIADDWYGDYFIPAGTVVIGNIWAILHDEERYPEPEAFKPERFLTEEGVLDPTVPDPVQVFGFGRRICPGRHFAETALRLYISHMLAAFAIEKPVDDAGNPVEPTQDCTARMFWYPKPFRAEFKPRLDELERLIRMPPGN
ncbi:cytochrome P450 [Phanerochaete sordida]|uniref:Cytochrome P450 n=1 Tax=Phanerochaete sordida TaxID=48140 RepID=A0A9P3GK49_9APHY|nr:cytochrome P450 [Phanerochaete sordida]